MAEESSFKVRVREELQHEFPDEQGWHVEAGVEMENGTCVDYLVTRGEEGAVVMCREVGSLVFESVDQVVSCREECGVPHAIIYLSKGAKAPAAVERYSQQRQVTLRCTNW